MSSTTISIFNITKHQQAPLSWRTEIMAENTCTPKALVLNFGQITDLHTELGLEAMACAIRMLGYQENFGRGVPEENIVEFLGISERKWNLMKKKITKFFFIREGRWVSEFTKQEHATYTAYPRENIASKVEIPKTESIQQSHREDPVMTEQRVHQADVLLNQKKPRKGVQANLFLSLPKIPGETVINSPHQALYQTAEKLFIRGGKSQAQAKACLGKIMKDNPNNSGLVFEVISEAWKKRDEIVDPYPWVLQSIKNRKTQQSEATNQKPYQGSRRIIQATGENMGISQARMEKIRKTNNEANKPLFDLTEIA